MELEWKEGLIIYLKIVILVIVKRIYFLIKNGGCGDYYKLSNKWGYYYRLVLICNSEIYIIRLVERFN